MLKPDFDPGEMLGVDLSMGAPMSRLPSRARVVATGLAAIAAMVALAVGVPWLLVRFVGNPLPAAVPTWEEFNWSITNGQIPDRFWIGLLAIVVWIAWAQLMMALIFEIVAVLRSVEAPTLPSFGFAHATAAHLVGAVLMLSVVLTTVPVDLAAARMVDASLPASNSSIEVSTVIEEAEVAAGPPIARVEVQRRQTLRSLATDHYGDAERWIDIRDHNIGRQMADGSVLPMGFTRIKAGWDLEVPDSESAVVIGKWTVAPGDHFWGIAQETLGSAYGRPPTDAEVHPYWQNLIEANRNALISTSPDLIYPGESFDVLLPPIPGDVDGTLDRLATTTPFAIEADGFTANGQDAPAAETVQDPAADPTDESRSADESELPAEAEESTQAAAMPGNLEGTSAVGSATSSDAAAALSGADDAGTDGIGVVSPGTGAAAPTLMPGESVFASASSGPSRDADRLDRPATAVTGGDVQTEPPESADQGTSSFPLARVAAGASGLGFLAAGFARALRRRRASQWARRVVGRVPAQPAAASVVLKNDLATSGSAVRPDFLDMATRAALSGVNDASSVVTHVEVADNELKFWSEGAVFELPVGHEIDGGLGWRISRDDVASLLVSPTDRGTAVLPLLLSIGRDDMTTRDVLLNLQHALTVDIRGPQAARSRFLSTAALELATSPFADDLRVVCCGFGGDVDGLQRIESVASVAEAIEVIRADPFSIIDVTDPDAAETFSNIVVLVDGPVIDSELDELAQLSLSGIAVLAADIPSHFSLELSPGTIEILPIGRTVIREELTAQHFAAMAELVSTSALTEYVTPDRLAVEPEIEVSDSEDQAFAGKPTVVEAASGDEFFDSGLDCDIELRVLGRVEVIGADRDFESARALDIISYLAFNRDGADADQLKTWIWPVDEPPTDKAFANVMTRARKGLGVDDEGQPYLSKAGTDGVYRLSKLVGTDFDQFQLLVEQSRDLDDDEALSRLVAAVRLVRSVPFTGGGAMGYLWTDNGVRAHIDYAIDEAVHRCADTALALGDSATARWAAFRGLTIVPGCEQCYRRRFLAASLDHNRSELSAAMVELQKMASLDQGEPEASDAISPELVELYEELMRHPTSTQNREAR